MDRDELARKLIETAAEKRGALLAEHSRLADAGLAGSLQKICYEVWTSEPQKVTAIVETLRRIEILNGDPEIKAFKDWTAAIEKLVNGRLEDCLRLLDRSEQTFQKLEKFHTAATTQISKLYALALLGRYDEAVACGLRARAVFHAHEDIYSVGKIEHNIGNLFWRRDLYREAEPFLSSAHRHFTQINDERQLAMVENCQAFVAALQNKFRDAERIYKTALERAAENDLTVTAAEIETGLSNLYLFQGSFDRALKFMERSRQTYELLGMPHQTANCELEIADIYLELNLLPEALSFYERVEEKYLQLGIQAELARSLQNHARAVFYLGDEELALQLLARAEKLFEAEGNAVAVAAAGLSKAEIYFGRGDFTMAEQNVKRALPAFIENGNDRYRLYAEWLAGEIRIGLNKDPKKTENLLRETLRKAVAERLHPVALRSLVSLGKLSGREKYFLDAVELIENSRAALAAEELRTAYFSDKLVPYDEIVKLKLSAGDFDAALAWHERARSRTLAETMDQAPKDALQNPQHAAQRQELNWYYSRINRQTASGLAARQTVSQLRKKAAKLEFELAEIERRQSSSRDSSGVAAGAFDLEKFQSLLPGTTVVEFAFFDRRLWAFVITEKSFDVFPYEIDFSTLRRETQQFLFQLKTGRFFEKLAAENRQAAQFRLLRRAQALYEALLRPLEKFCGGNHRLVIVPANFLHYLPFQALHDGQRFLVEKKQLSYAPSLTVLENSLNRQISVPENALLVGVADPRTPLVETEIELLGNLFKNSLRLTGELATLENLRENAAAADVLHLACHGKFRLDNPSFSALNLFKENLTVRDAQHLSLQNKLVVLSACETGLNKIVSGEELLGLTRGFLAGGAASLVLSLWTLNDRSALELMRRFYTERLSGKPAGAALQIAQLSLLKENPHPYFWSPFVLVGHW